MSTAPIPTASRVVVEPSAWLRSRARRRVVQLSRHRVHVSPLLGTAVVVAYLNGPVERGSRADRTCDRCGMFCPVGSDYGVAMHVIDYRERRYFIVFGLCPRCGELEQPRETWGDGS